MESKTLVNDEGVSDKFWSIRVNGTTHTVHYGRVGTDGQVKTKDLDSPEQAIEAARKLIAEKLRKGYREAGERPPAPDPVAIPGPVDAATAAEPEPVPVPVPLDHDRPPIDLTPAEWSLATWRPLPPPPSGEPRPFDPQVLREALKLGRAEWGWWHWTASPIRTPMTRQEAEYWLRVTEPLRNQSALERHREVIDLPISMGADEAILRATVSGLPSGDALAALVAIIGPAATAEALLREPPEPPERWRYQGGHPVDGVRSHLLPLLDAAERELLATTVQAGLEEALQDSDFVTGDVAILAAQLGLHAGVEEVCARWTDGWFAEGGGRGGYGAIALGVGSAATLEALVERTKLRMDTETLVAGWLAHTEELRLDVIVSSALRTESKDAASAAVRAFAARVHGAAAAPGMLELVRGSRASQSARAWFDAHPAQAVAGLAPLLARTGALAEAAQDELQRLVRGPHRGVVEAVAAQLEDGHRFRTQVLDVAAAVPSPLAEAPSWLADADSRTRKAALPAWLEPDGLPPLVLDGGSAGPEVVAAVLRLLRSGDEPGLTDLRAAVVDAEAFSWGLFDAWLVAGGPTKDKWAMAQMGGLGSDRTAIRLTQLIRAWPGESQHKRAVLGLDVLAGIGSDVALMQLNGIAQKIKYKALKERAREAMDEIATAKGMTKGELEDRIVPDCGLDAEGTRSFDFGPRQFTFVLGPGMKPMLRDASGKLRPNPPKPGAKDDPVLAPKAVEEWKLVRKTVADVAKLQALRLEQAMVGGRRWAPGDFRALLVEHPLQRHLVRTLVLGTYAAGRLEGTFRLTEEGDFADAQDEPFSLPDGVEVGIVHPLTLEEPTRAAWGEVLADYELVPSFPQLGRPVHDVDPGDLGRREITRFDKARISPGPLLRILENGGWERGMPEDGGVYHEHTKHFPGADTTVVVEYGWGIPIGYMEGAEPQKLERIHASRGTPSSEIGSGGWTERFRNRRMKWREVDPIVRSEVMADVLALVAKAEE